MGKPKPFSRPSINLGGGPKKDWQEVEVQVLVRGDTVRGFGTIDWIDIDQEVSMVAVTWQNGTMSLFDPTDVVTAFTAV